MEKKSWVEFGIIVVGITVLIVCGMISDVNKRLVNSTHTRGYDFCTDTLHGEQTWTNLVDEDGNRYQYKVLTCVTK
jgi:hypothetical protein